MKCWEYMQCSRACTEVAVGIERCPAYPDHGNHCARVAGTLCNGQVQGTFAKKLSGCIRCDYYNSPHYDKTYTGASVCI